MRLVIIIPVFNRALTLGNCLNQLHSQIKQIPSFHSIGVVVVNDGSTDGTSRLLKEKHKWVKVVNGTGNWWFTKSVNEGLRYAEKTLSPDSFLLLNEDLILAEDYLNSVLNTLSNQESNNMIFGSLTLDASDPSKYLFVGYKKWVSLINKKQAYRQKDIDEAKKKRGHMASQCFSTREGDVF